MKINILLVDDHELFRTGVQFMLSDFAKASYILEAENCDAAIKIAEKTKIDLVLLDLDLPGTSGMDAFDLLREKIVGAVFVIVSAETNSSTVRQLAAAKAAGFISKSSSAAVMLAALQLVIAGGRYFPLEILQDSHASSSTTSKKQLLHGLTGRQIDTLRLAIKGMGNKEIAKKLEISEATVKAHLSASFRLLAVRNRTEAAAAAVKIGLTSPGAV